MLLIIWLINYSKDIAVNNPTSKDGGFHCGGCVSNNSFTFTSVYLHENMVAYYAGVISKTVNIDDSKIIIASKLHDHGKLLWNEELFIKTHGQLTQSDFQTIAMHPLNSVSVIINQIPERKKEFSEGDPSIFDLILYHHEKPNGSGYYRVVNVPIEAVVIAISDIFDACLSDRLYRKGLGFKESLENAFFDYADYLESNGYDVKQIKRNLLESAVAISLGTI